MKIITILSGKGGVGKSSITASLAIVLSRHYKIITADCDVDASNLALVFGIEEKDYQEWEPISTNQRPIFNLKKCQSCQQCFNSCYFEAIDWINNKPKLKEFICEGCGVCEMVCPQGAVKLVSVDNAKIGYGKTKYGFKVVSAQLVVGESGSGKVVTEVRKKAEQLAGGADIMLIDSAAGIGCPVIASVVGSNFCILVTEPTPSGFSDMTRALEIVKHFNIPAGIIINMFDINKLYSKKIEQFAKQNNMAVMERLPYDKSFVQALVNMTPVIEKNKEIEKLFVNIGKQLKKQDFLSGL